MNIAVDFIRANRIDSFQKLYVLLFLDQHPNLAGSSQYLAKKLHLAHLSLVEKNLDDLTSVGLVNRAGKRYKLCANSRARSDLHSLAEAVKDPQMHAAILEQVQ